MYWCNVIFLPLASDLFKTLQLLQLWSLAVKEIWVCVKHGQAWTHKQWVMWLVYLGLYVGMFSIFLEISKPSQKVRYGFLVEFDPANLFDCLKSATVRRWIWTKHHPSLTAVVAYILWLACNPPVADGASNNPGPRYRGPVRFELSLIKSEHPGLVKSEQNT